MRMRTRSAGLLFTVAAAATSVAVVLNAGVAYAATTISITSPNSDGSYSAVTAHSSFIDLNSGVSLTCIAGGGEAYGSRGTGVLAPQRGTALPANLSTAIQSLLFNDAGGCTSLLGSVTARATGGPYSLVVENYPGVRSDGVTPANGDGYTRITNVNVSMPACSFTISGDAPGYYDNATHSLNLTADVAPANGTAATGDVTLPDGPLTVHNVSGCLGEVNNGDIGAYYATSDPQDPFGNDTPYVLNAAVQVSSP